MNIINSSVLILKAETSSLDKYKNALEKEGYEVKLLKTLDFNYINLYLLLNELKNPQLYNGIIFTSPRTVNAIGKAIENLSLDTSWIEKHNYVVGESTADCVEKQLNLKSRGKCSGNANELAKVIINENKDCDKPFLFPCGNLKTESLIKDLQDNNIHVKTVTVYETIASCSLDEDFKELTENFTNIPKYFVFFSPSGIKYTKVYLDKLKDVRDSLRFIAIGPSTHASLQNENIKSFVALKPNAVELVKVITNCN